MQRIVFLFVFSLLLYLLHLPNLSDICFHHCNLFHDFYNIIIFGEDNQFYILNSSTFHQRMTNNSGLVVFLPTFNRIIRFGSFPFAFLS